MYSSNSENERFGITQILISLHPDQALQLLIGVFAEWAEEQSRRQLGKFDKLAAMRSFLVLLRRELDSRLLLRLPQTIPRRNDLEISSASLQTLKKNKESLLSLMESMSLNNAMRFLAEITVTWCFSIPEKFFPLIPVTLRDTSDKSLADAIYLWFTRYFDLWD
jgi:hypothetical protein